MLTIDIKSVYSLLLDHSRSGGRGSMFKYCQVEMPAPLVYGRFAIATQGEDFISQLDVLFESEKSTLTSGSLFAAMARRFGNRWATLPDESIGYLIEARSEHPCVELQFSGGRVRLMVGAWGTLESQFAWSGLMVFKSARDQNPQHVSLLGDRMPATCVQWLPAGDYRQFQTWMSDLEAVANTVVDTIIANAPPTPIARVFLEKRIELVLSIAGSEPIRR